MLSEQEERGGTGQHGTDQPCSPAWWQNQWASRRDPVLSWHLERGGTGINNILRASRPKSSRTNPFRAVLDTLSIPNSSVSQAQVNSRAHPCTEGASCKEISGYFGNHSTYSQPLPCCTVPRRCQGRALTVAVEELEFVVCAVVRLLVALLLKGNFKKKRGKKILPELTLGTFKMQELIIMMEVTTKFIKILRGESTDWDVLTFRVTQDKLQNTADIFSCSSRTSFPLLFAITFSTFSRQYIEKNLCISNQLVKSRLMGENAVAYDLSVMIALQ